MLLCGVPPRGPAAAKYTALTGLGVPACARVMRVRAGAVPVGDMQLVNDQLRTPTSCLRACMHQQQAMHVTATSTRAHARTCAWLACMCAASLGHALHATVAVCVPAMSAAFGTATVSVPIG